VSLGLRYERADAYFMDAMMMDGLRIQWLNLLVLAGFGFVFSHTWWRYTI
jgi:hypothetical protein